MITTKYVANTVKMRKRENGQENRTCANTPDDLLARLLVHVHDVKMTEITRIFMVM